MEHAAVKESAPSPTADEARGLAGPFTWRSETFIAHMPEFAKRLNDAAALLSRIPGDEATEGYEYMLGVLRIIVRESSDKQIAAIAQAGIDLATLGEEACAEMRGETPITRAPGAGA